MTDDSYKGDVSENELSDWVFYASEAVILEQQGRGVEVDNKKAEHYYELAAMGGCAKARYNLGTLEYNSRNMNRALRHYAIAVTDGDLDSLDTIKIMYLKGYVTKDDYASTLRAYQVSLDEMKSEQRMSYNPGKVRQFDGHYCLVCQR